VTARDGFCAKTPSSSSTVARWRRKRMDKRLGGRLRRPPHLRSCKKASLQRPLLITARPPRNVIQSTTTTIPPFINAVSMGQECKRIGPRRRVSTRASLPRRKSQLCGTHVQGHRERSPKRRSRTPHPRRVLASRPLIHRAGPTS
jgi:hypothetical protein